MAVRHKIDDHTTHKKSQQTKETAHTFAWKWEKKWSAFCVRNEWKPINVIIVSAHNYCVILISRNW